MHSCRLRINLMRPLSLNDQHRALHGLEPSRNWIPFLGRSQGVYWVWWHIISSIVKMTIMRHNLSRMLIVYVIISHLDIIMLHFNISMLHVDIKKSHVSIIISHRDIIHLACSGQKYATIDFTNFNNGNCFQIVKTSRLRCDFTR